MATLISEHDFSSRRNGRKRCDRRCYDGIRRKCRCVCTGDNHGVGLVVAAENTYYLREKWKRQWWDAHPDEEPEPAPPHETQLELFA